MWWPRAEETTDRTCKKEMNPQKNPNNRPVCIISISLMPLDTLFWREAPRICRTNWELNRIFFLKEPIYIAAQTIVGCFWPHEAIACSFFLCKVQNLRAREGVGQNPPPFLGGVGGTSPLPSSWTFFWLLYIPDPPPHRWMVGLNQSKSLKQNLTRGRGQGLLEDVLKPCLWVGRIDCWSPPSSTWTHRRQPGTLLLPYPVAGNWVRSADSAELLYFSHEMGKKSRRTNSPLKLSGGS